MGEGIGAEVGQERPPEVEVEVKADGDTEIGAIHGVAVAVAGHLC